jgi:nucleotide-binding universal stress UspA family protein
MFKKILLPVDGSRHCMEAARAAGELSVKHGGTVEPLVAVDYHHLTNGDLTESLIASIRHKIEARAEEALTSAAAAVRSAGGTAVQGKVLEGDPHEVILREAEEGEFDVIVIGSRGVSEDSGRSRLLGSVAERVLHQTPCPVLVIRAEPKP